MLTLFLCLSGLAFAERGDYEEALPLLNISSQAIPKELHHKFYFYKTITEFQLLKKEEAKVSILKFYQSFDSPPRRYEALIYGIQNQLNIEPSALGAIADKMGDVKRRLDKFKGGEVTQQKQQEIVNDLAKLIEEAENDAKAKSEAEKKQNETDLEKKKDGSVPKNQLTPADESVIMGGVGRGEVKEKDLRQIAEQWGSLPPEKRARIVEDITRDVPNKYRSAIEEYFKALNKIHK